MNREVEIGAGKNITNIYVSQWTSTRTTTHTYVHVTPIEATELQARAPRTTAPTSTQPDLGDPATFKYISFSRTSWITSRTTQVEIIRWPPKTRGICFSWIPILLAYSVLIVACS